MDKEWFFDNAKKLLLSMRKISAGTVLLMWALAMISGVFIYKLVSGNNPAKKEITMTFATWWDDELEGETFSALCSEYQVQNPGITIKLEKLNWDTIQELLEKKDSKDSNKNAQKINPPDIFSIDPYAVYELEKKSLLAKLEDDRNFTGNIVSIISFINPLYYNIGLLQDAGFDRPPKNQTEFLSYVQRIKETGKFGAGIALSDLRHVNQQLLSWIWAAVGNPDVSSSFASKEVIDTLNFLNLLYQNLYDNPFELSKAKLLEAFGKGEIGMMIGSIADIREIKRTNINFSITTIPAPVSYTKKPVFPLSVWYVGIYSKSEYQEEAKDFILFLKKKSGEIAAAAYAVPGNGTLDRELSKEDLYYAKAFDMYEAGEMVRELYHSQNISQFNDIIIREVRFMFQGSKTPKECAEAIQYNWENLAGITPAVP
ncbi:MAG: extracellular solute-binding protein [Treponema sp.]|nr:extracellular solute-binding protein [Treponema sp.]